MHFVDRLFAGIRRVGNPVLVGIDPRPEELPPGFLERFSADREGVSQALVSFGREVIDVVAPWSLPSNSSPLSMRPTAPRA